MTEPRTDVERCLLLDPIPPPGLPVYDLDIGPTPVELVSWSDETLRKEVVRQIVHFVGCAPPIRPFTGAKVSKHMRSQPYGLRLWGYLVHPEFYGRLVHVGAGRNEPVFVHYDVPPGIAIAMCEPEYLGRIPEKDGLRGILVYNPRGIAWGELDAKLS